MWPAWGSSPFDGWSAADAVVVIGWSCAALPAPSGRALSGSPPRLKVAGAIPSLGRVAWIGLVPGGLQPAPALAGPGRRLGSAVLLVDRRGRRLVQGQGHPAGHGALRARPRFRQLGGVRQAGQR